MEQPMKRRQVIQTFFLSVFMLTAGTPTVRADAVPSDIPLIEALIALHKLQMKKESDALVKTEANKLEQKEVTAQSKKYRFNRDTLNSYLNTGLEYVTLAAKIVHTTSSLYKLTKNYDKFNRKALEVAGKDKFALWYFAEAQHALSKDIKKFRTYVATLAAEQFNILHATMEDRYMMLARMQLLIDETNGTISKYYHKINMMSNNFIRIDKVWEILDSELTDSIAIGIINEWYEQT